jgi:DNA-binding MarR family transcriptional regulator
VIYKDAATDQLVDVARALENVVTWLRRSSQGSTMSLSSLSALALLDAEGPLRVTQLAAREGLTQPGMTTLLNRLEEAGLATRQPDPDDGRALRVSITESGRETLETSRAGRQQLIYERLHELSSDDHEALATALPALTHFTATSTTRNEASSR